MAGVHELRAAPFDQQALTRLMEAQRAYHLSGATMRYEFRARQLKRLYQALRKHEERMHQAVAADLGKPVMESYISEVGFLLAELTHAIKHLKSWMKPQRVPTPMALQPASSYIYSAPRGQVLIIGPWNYPFNLTLGPLIGAIAGGNCAVLKPSELSPRSSAVMAELVAETFAPEYVAVLEGGPEMATALLGNRWDYIFFTGGVQVGKIVARAAAEHLTPYTLELGGKSPCIVEADADLEQAARRIVWGKFFNTGQTCVAPDYLLVQRSVKPKFLEIMKQVMAEFYGPEPAKSPDYGRIINERHFDRLVAMLSSGEVVVGGQSDRASRFIAPTLLDNVSLSDPVMQEEIFGPILPVITYDHLDEAIAVVRQLPNPLALYLFSHDKQIERRVIEELPFGGGCINQTVNHFGNPELPFGGVGSSGIGAYHGKFSFDTFTHKKGVLHQSSLWEPPLKYQPYRHPYKLKLIRQVMK